MKPVRFHPEARAEALDAARYYNAQQPGLGIRIILSLEAGAARISSNPGLFRFVEGGIRKCRVTRFPYGLLFRERDADHEIIAVMHLHREPGYWKSRI